MNTQNKKDALWHGQECISGSYSIVRYVPSFARGEQLNIGIVLWTDDDFRIDIDTDAVHRLKRDNVNLVEDKLLSLRWTMRDYLSPAAAFSRNEFADIVQSLSRFPLIITEPLFVAVPTMAEEPLDRVLEWLIQTVVHPRSLGFASQKDPRVLVARQLSPLIKQGLIERDYPIAKSVSGVPRKVNYFGNHGANVALDIVRMQVKDGNEIVNRADAESNRARDILQANGGMKFHVYCDQSDSEELRSANQAARQILEKCGAIVTADMQQAILAVSSAVFKEARKGS